MISKTYCPVPFNHLYIKPNNKAGVCCAFEREQEIFSLPDIKEYKNLSDHLHHPFIKDIQQKMLKGEKVPGCKRCYYFEEHGHGESMREGFISTWYEEGRSGINYTPPDLDNPKLDFLEVTFGNYCNLACRICSSDLSHSWIEDEKELKLIGIHSNSRGTTKRMNIDRDWQDDDLKDLQYLKITGGEPMLHPDFTKFIERVQHSNVTLDIFTNASWVPKKKLLNLLLKFKFCNIYVSIDGTGTVQEYMRHNSNWDITEKSVRKWLEMMKIHDNIQIDWAPTWSLMNGNYFIETCNWWLKTINKICKDKADKCHGGIGNFLLYPEHYRMNLLPNQNELKQKAEKYITELKNSSYSGVENIIEMTEEYIKFFEVKSKNEIISKNAYYKTTQALDEIRNQSLKEMMPLTYKAMYNE